MDGPKRRRGALGLIPMRRVAVLATVGAVALSLAAPTLAAPARTTPTAQAPTALVAGSSALSADMPAAGAAGLSGASASAQATSARSRKPLAGITIALDPGHQLGNSNPAFRSNLAQSKFNGTSVKGCNTTGTATPGGYPEATFVWNVSQYVKKRLQRLGAKVRMTRTTNSYNAWGPCVWNRGLFGKKVGADLLVSVHADGAAANYRGFYVMVPTSIRGWTDDIAAPSRRAGERMIAGMASAGATRANYVRDQMLVTNNISTLNFSDVPAVLVEVGNMRNPSEASFMVTDRGQRAHAKWLVAGIRSALRR